MPNRDDDEALEDAEQFLDHFLEETTVLRLSTEASLDEISQLSNKFPRDSSIGDKLSILRQNLEQLAHSLSGKFELVNSFVRDGTDVIDGRLALTTRLLSERCDEISVAIAQMSNELNQLRDDLTAQLAASAPAPVMTQELAAVDASGRIEENLAEILRGIESMNLNVARNLAEVEARLTKIEAAVNRAPSRRGMSTLTFAAAVILPLILAAACAMAWVRYGR